MIEVRIYHNDIMMVAPSIKLARGDIVVTQHHGEFIVQAMC